MFKALPDLLFRTDATGKIVDYSAGRTADLYVPPETFLGKTFAEVLPDGLGGVVAAEAERAHRTNQVESLEYDLVVPAGQQRFEARFVPFLEGQTVVVVRNVTERWQAQEALKASEERLRESERLEATGRLAGGIAHDFNNLLTVIPTYSDLLLDDGCRPQRRCAEQIEEIRRRAAARRRSDAAAPRLQPASRSLTAARSSTSTTSSATSRRCCAGVIGEDIELAHRAAHPDLGPVRADAGQLEQVIMNLAVNARDAMPHGGRIIIETANANAGRGLRRVATSRCGRAAVRAARGHRHRSRHGARGRRAHLRAVLHDQGGGQGTGLGLSTVYGIVRQSGGASRWRPRPAKAAPFPPLAARWRRAGGTVVPDFAEPRGTETILVVEDEPAVRRALGDSLRRLGYQTLEAENAEAALEICKTYEGTIHVLLTDVVMPGLSGYGSPHSSSRPARPPS